MQPVATPRELLPQARLVGLTGPVTGRSFPLPGPHALLGRAPGCDVVIDDPHVSREHAVLERGPGGAAVRDLGSTSGTLVNGRLVDRSWPVRSGDTVTVGGLVLRFEEASGLLPETTALPRQRAGTPGPVPAATVPGASHVEYRVDRQTGEHITNIGRDQVVVEARESFLRDVATTRTRARVLVWLGAAVSVVGFALWAGNILDFIRRLSEADVGTALELDLLGPDVLGVPLGVIGFGLTFVGTVLLVVGVVLHVVAAARRRRIDRDLPPWAAAQGHRTGRSRP